MTKQEINASTRAKIEKINALAQELQIKIDAEQVVTQRMTIQTVVTFVDMEKYETDPVVTRPPLPEQPTTDETATPTIPQ